MEGDLQCGIRNPNSIDRMIDPTEGAVIEEGLVISEIWATRWMPMELS